MALTDAGASPAMPAQRDPLLTATGLEKHFPVRRGLLQPGRGEQRVPLRRHGRARARVGQSHAATSFSRISCRCASSR